MPKGRTPKPEHLKDLSSTEPKPILGWPKTPPAVANDPIALAYWEELCETLDEMGVLSQADHHAMSLLAQLHSQWTECQEFISINGMVSEGPNGGEYESAHVKTADRILRQIQRLLVQFGLTPASRKQVNIVPKESTDELATFLKKKA